MKNILITGGAGFIGSHLSLALLKRGYNVTVLDNLKEQIHGKNPDVSSPLYISIKNKVDLIKCSITSRQGLEQAIKGQNIIVHLAAETGTGQSMYKIANYTDVNVQGTALLLDILTNNPHQIEKIIVASSRAIYGEGKYYSNELGVVYPNHRQNIDMQKGDFEVKYPNSGPLEVMPTDENSKIHPSSVYGISKQIQEQLIMSVCNAIGIAPIAFRYQNVYGPGQSLTNPYTGILSIFSNRIRSGQNINIFEDGKESRDFVFITDVIDATIAGIENDAAKNKIFNVGIGRPLTVLEVAKTLIRKFEKEVPLNISGMFRLGDIRHNYADISLLEQILGVTPKVGFEEGITEFVHWVNQQTLSENNYEFSLEEMRKKGLLK